MSQGLLERLEAVPSWSAGAIRALERERAALQALGDARPDALRLRVSELLRASGAHAQAHELLRAIDPAGLDADRRWRYAFLQARYLVLLPGGEIPSLGDPRPIGALRDATLEAEAATMRQEHARAETAWREVLRTDLDGLPADELVFDAGFGLGRLLVARQRGPEAIEPLQRADRVAARHGADADRAALSFWWFLALQAKGDRRAIVALARRAAGLPADVTGALPVALVEQLIAAGDAREGRLGVGLERLHAAKIAARERRDREGYAALALSEAKLVAAAGAPYEAFKTLKLAQANLRRLDATELADMLQHEVAALRAGVGDEAFEAMVARLRSEAAPPG